MPPAYPPTTNAAFALLTTCPPLSVPVLAVKPPVPSKTACTACVPAESVDVVKVQVPGVPPAIPATGVPPSITKLTVPVGVAAPATVAVNVTESP